MTTRHLRIVFTGVFLVTLFALVLTLARRSGDVGSDPEDAELSESAEDTGPAPLEAQTVYHKVSAGQTFGSIAERYGIKGVRGLVKACKTHTNLEKIRPGEVLEITMLGEQPLGFRYAIDRDRTLVVGLAEPVSVSVETQTYERTIVTVDLSIDSSLWQAGRSAGFSPAQVMEMTKVFENEVDFNVDLRPGAQISVVVEQLSKDGKFVRFGELQAMWFKNRGKHWTAVSYTNKKGQSDWYDLNGEPLHPSVVVVKSAPQGFGPPFRYGHYLQHQRKSRRRPLKKGDLYVTADFYQPRCKGKCRHSALDFRAAVGTPVTAIGSGTVRALTNPRGLCGNGVQLEMTDGKGQAWRVLYCHLSKIKVKKKQKVKRGQIVGLSGGKPGAFGAGNTTGPHLHMELRARSKKGSYRIVDPMPYLSWGDFRLKGRFTKGKKPKQTKRPPKIIPPKPLLKTGERAPFITRRDSLVPLLNTIASEGG
jgi:murein DD-endopeptidase MepM/ murein hydrolase activator NlpD